MESKEHLENLSYIRSMMESSTRFISLSGLSGVAAGAWALIGAGVVYFYSDGGYDGIPSSEYPMGISAMNFELGVAMVVLALALLSGYFFTARKAKKGGAKFWSKASMRLSVNLAIPLVAGGLFCLILMHHGFWTMVGPCTLIFYGLGLVNGGKYTVDDIRKLGLIEIVLGLISAFWLKYTLLFWALGFGVLHIFYGALMYFKYEK